MVNIRSQTKTPKSDVREAARQYIRRGWAVVPVPKGEKAPRIKGWPDLRISADEVDKYFNSDDNIGVLLGEPSGGLIDIDLDSPEAIALADEFLPPTNALFGRTGKPRSHRLYIAPGAETVKWSDPAGGMLLELRSTGCQTIVPPSVHPSGEAIEWVEGGEPAAWGSGQ